MSAYAERVAVHGLGGSHALILAEVPPGSRVLDVGCASGYLAAELTARGCTVVGFERDPAAAALAEASCAELIVGDLESDADLAALPRGFDAVVIGDVLEHLTDPWRALRELRGVLAPGGVVVLSLPNVAAWPVRLGLLRGRFECILAAGPPPLTSHPEGCDDRERRSWRSNDPGCTGDWAGTREDAERACRPTRASPDERAPRAAGGPAARDQGAGS